ncbi:addiction module antidote protein [Sphingosinicella rhizophila]|uniref:Addiction module antidote protein n=1 Tax=Sphingosinicella rhizophila TaxID=3050082 RepID=A0ABU3QAN4_9SPHN|nr:addiction module antidote protein [Sphingosinicella sp. GR2756]MDT9600058.1 addiction module antidote protein [Sphingosinicella sp. GR2756]
MNMLIEMLAARPRLQDLHESPARIVSALRLSIVARRTRQCPLGAAAARLGSRRAAAHLHLLMEEIGTAWPEPFCVSPPCCAFLSHDEALVARMFALASEGDRPGFDRLLSDLLPDHVRERLYLSSNVLSMVVQV